MTLTVQKKGGGRKSCNHAEGGGGVNKIEVVLTGELEVLAILKGGAKGFHFLKGWACFEGGTRKRKGFGPAIF